MTKTYFKKQSYQNDHTLKKRRIRPTKRNLKFAKVNAKQPEKREKSVEKSKETISETKTRKTRANEV